MAEVTVSIVSHGHAALLPALLADLSACPEIVAVIITHNIPEQAVSLDWKGPVEIIHNALPKGFGANHNAAFARCKSRFFAVLNPDIRLSGNPFPELLRAFDDATVALAAPAVVNPAGAPEDSARQFPSLSSLLRKALRGADGRVDYALGDNPLVVPWVAGMFHVYRASAYADLHGFDEKYFLYYEDVDICARIFKHGLHVMLCPTVRVIHDARRDSHRKPRFLLWHISSLLRYLRRHYRLPHRYAQT